MDTETFKQQFIPLNGRLYLLALRLLADTDDARDAVQEVYLKLWEMRRKLSGVERPEAFAVTMLRNHCLDIIRCRHDAESLSGRNPALDPAADDLGHSIECRDRLQRVVDAIENLPPSQRVAITMRDLSGCDMNEIQTALGVSPDNARVLLSRARASIRKLFVN